MKFYTNKISTGKPTNFGEFVEKLAKANAVTKTASTAAPVKKEANLANLGDNKAAPFGAKDKKDEPKKEEEKKDDKKPACETDACASAEKEIKVAEEAKVDKDGEMHVEKQEMDPVGGTNTGKPEGEKKEAASATVAKKASNDEVPAENKGRTHGPDECCGAPSSKGDDGSEGEKKKSEKTEEKKEASSIKYIKIANLDAKTKNEWKAYWKKLYPSEYADAMFADK